VYGLKPGEAPALCLLLQATLQRGHHLFVCQHCPQVWDNLRKILLFNLPVNFAQGTSIFWAYVIGFHVSPLTAIQVRPSLG
jgi:hypothetical protein